tara:strand:+ start:92965 stop:93537 length:573 start_codon:yes stop_codon:yes gene_type:complete
MSLHEEKKHLRTSLKQRRSLVSRNERKEMSQQICKYLHELDVFNHAKSIFCYISYLSEVETHTLINGFIDQNLALAVPKIIEKSRMIAVPLTDLSDLEPDKMGILTPKGNQPASTPFDIALTPGVGFTAKGERLGYGKGYYDRWFSQNVVKTKIGIAFEIQLLKQLPVEKTDVSLDILVTEERIIDLRNP